MVTAEYHMSVAKAWITLFEGVLEATRNIKEDETRLRLECYFWAVTAYHAIGTVLANRLAAT